MPMNFQIILDALLIVFAFLLIVWQLFDSHLNYKGVSAMAMLLAYFYFHIHGEIQPITVLIFFITGFIFLILEIFLPGGIVGIFGLILIIYSIVKDNVQLLSIAIILLLATIIAIMFFLYLYRYLNKEVKLLQIFILNDRATTEDGYTSHQERYDLIGKKMITMTDLRPSGIVKYLDERLDVVSEGEYISKGTEVQVIYVEGMKIVVRSL